MRFSMPNRRQVLNCVLIFATSVAYFLMADRLSAQNNDALLQVFSNSGVASAGNFTFDQTADLDLSGSNWGFGVDESEAYLAALKHTQSGGPASQDWEIRLGRGGQIYSIQSEVGEIVPPQSFERPFNDEVFQAISVDTSPRDTGGQAAFYHQAGYYVDGSTISQPTYSPMLANGAVESNSYSTMSLAVQADPDSIPQQPAGLLNYQRTRDLGEGVIEVTHSIYNFGNDTVNFHNLPWGGVRWTVFDNMLVSEAGGGFTGRAIDDFSNFQNQVEFADDTGGWAAFTEGTDGSDRGLAYVFGDTDTHLAEDWQTNESSWRWGRADGDILGLPVRNFNVGTFRREVDVNPGDLFESRYFLMLGDVDHIQDTIAERNLVENATYDKRIIDEIDSSILFYKIVDDNGTTSVIESAFDEVSDFGTYAIPVNGSVPLFLFEDELGNEFMSIDPYSLSDFAYDRVTDYKGVLGFVLPSELASADGSYIDMAALFPGGDFYLNSDPSRTILGLRGNSVPEPSGGILMAFVLAGWCARRRRVNQARCFER